MSAIFGRMDIKVCNESIWSHVLDTPRQNFKVSFPRKLCKRAAPFSVTRSLVLKWNFKVNALLVCEDITSFLMRCFSEVRERLKSSVDDVFKQIWCSYTVVQIILTATMISRSSSQALYFVLFQLKTFVVIISPAITVFLPLCVYFLPLPFANLFHSNIWSHYCLINTNQSCWHGSLVNKQFVLVVSTERIIGS